MPRLAVFIGSSLEARPVAEALASALGGTFPCSPWWTIFEPGTFTLEALETAIRGHRFAVFIGGADDAIVRRDRLEPVIRDNVIAEFLMFVGANGRDHTYLLADRASKPTLPSDLAGLVFTTYDAEEFTRNPSGAIAEACQMIMRRITSVNQADNKLRRELEAKTLADAMAQQIAELGDLAFLLRDIVDAVQRDTLEALFDEQKFADIKHAAATRIEEACKPHEQKARSARVQDEFLRLKNAVARTVADLPFPRDLFTGIDEAKSAYGNSVFGLIEPFADALKQSDWDTALELGLSLRSRLTMEAVAGEVARIADDRLHQLKDSYARWWRSHSRAVRDSLNAFHRALLHAQTRLALRTGDPHQPTEE